MGKNKQGHLSSSASIYSERRPSNLQRAQGTEGPNMNCKTLFIVFLILSGLVFSIFKSATINSWQISMTKVRDHNPFSHCTKGKTVIQRKFESVQGHTDLLQSPRPKFFISTSGEHCSAAHSQHQIHNASSSSDRNSSTATV